MLSEVLAHESVVNLAGVFYRRAHLRDWLIVRLIDTATGVALLSGILHPTTVVNTVTHVGPHKRKKSLKRTNETALNILSDLT